MDKVTLQTNSREYIINAYVCQQNAIHLDRNFEGYFEITQYVINNDIKEKIEDFREFRWNNKTWRIEEKEEINIRGKCQGSFSVNNPPGWRFYVSLLTDV